MIVYARAPLLSRSAVQGAGLVDGRADASSSGPLRQRRAVHGHDAVGDLDAVAPDRDTRLT
jgi:hypothetical protein